MKKVWVLGIGPGEEDYLLPLAKRRAEEAEVLVGGKRALDLLAGPGQETKEIKGSLALIVDYIKEKGFELGLQMMPGLFGDSEEDVFETAKKLADLKPATMRIYPTVVLKNTYLAELFEKGEYTPLSLENAVDISSKLLRFFESKNIKVIKLGLHASETLSSGYLAGPYHPAFRELCESRVFLNKLIMQLNSYPNGSYEVLVNPKFISKALGQKQENVFKLKQSGYNICFKQDNNINSDSFIIRKG